MSLSKREILFILKMQNESKAAIKAMGKDLREAFANAEKLGTSMDELGSGGTKLAIKDLKGFNAELVTAENHAKALQQLIADFGSGMKFDGTGYGEALKILKEGGQNPADANAEELNSLMNLRKIALERLGIAEEVVGEQAQEAGRKAQEAMEKARKGTEELNRSTVGLSNGFKFLKGAAVAALAYLGGSKIIREADAWKNLTGQLRLVTTSEENLVAVREELIRVSNATFSDLASTTGLYTKLAQRSEQLGMSQEELIGLTENFSKAMQVGGSSAAEAAAATRQFTQAVSAGSLRGDELNSIIENAPGLAMAFEDGLRAAGKEVTSLKKYIADANPTILEMLDALGSQSGVIAEKFAALPTTVGQGMTVLSNAFTVFIGKVDEASKGTDGIAKFLLRLAAILSDPKFIETVAKLANLLGGALNTALDLVVGVLEYLRDNTREVVVATSMLLALYAAFKWQAIATGIMAIATAFYAKAGAIWAAIAALKTLKGAIIATGIGVFVVLVGYLVNMLMEYGEATTTAAGVTVTGWAKIRAIIVGVWAAITKAVEVSWGNLKSILSAMGEALMNTGRAVMALMGGDFAGAAKIGADNVDLLANAVGNLQDVLGPSNAAFNEAYTDSIRQSFANSIGMGADGAVSDVAPPRPDAALSDEDGDNDAASGREDARKALQQRIKDTEMATAEQIRLNGAILEGPAAVRALNVELAYERELREALRTLEDAGITGQEAQTLAEASALATKNGELAKQAEQVSNLTFEMGKAIEQQELQLELQQASVNLLFEEDAGRRRAIISTLTYEDRLRQLTDAFVDAEIGTELYTEQLRKAEAAARDFADAQQRGSDATLVSDLLREGSTNLQNLQREYRETTEAVEAFLEANGPLALTIDQSERLARALERIRPPENVFDALNQGLRDYADQIEPTLLDIRDLGTGVFTSIGDAVADMALTGKANFGDLARSIISDISRMIIRALIFRTIMSFLPGLGAGGFASSVASNMQTTAANVASFSIGHTGGIAGIVGASRQANPAMFGGAGKYHRGGLAGMGSLPGEIPVIAKQNEAILPTVRLPDGNFGVKADMSGGGGGTFAPQFNINVAGDAGGAVAGMSPDQQEKFAQMLQEEINMHTQRVLEKETRPGGMLSKAMKRR